MGCSSSSPEELQAKKRNRSYERELSSEAKADSNKVKLLLLGAGESGKTTIFKQMKIIYGENYTEADRKKAIPTIFSNVIVGMKGLCEQIVSMGYYDQLTSKEEHEVVINLDDSDVISPDIGGILKALWLDKVVQDVWKRRNEFQINDCVGIYMDKIDEIKDPNYIPSEKDLLSSRVRTSGIVTEKYNIKGTTFEMYDVGGQRNERKKWIHCFDGVTAVIFVAAISEVTSLLLIPISIILYFAYIFIVRPKVI